MRMLSWSTVWMGAIWLLAGCTHSLHAERPVVSQNVANNWNSAPLATSAAQPLHQAWWQEFDSATLTELINRALSSNPDVRIAAERIIQAEAQVQLANASLFPSLNLGAGSDKNWQQASSAASSSRESTAASLSISYELDLWGKLAAERQVAAAGLAISQYDLASAQLTLTTGVARAWFQFLTLTERVHINEENLTIAQQNLAIVEAKYKYGAAGLSDVYRQRGVVNNQEASLLPLREQRRQTESALAILLGQAPQGYQLNGEPLKAITLPTLEAGLPSELLNRRPDLAAAEAQLQAADANVKAARAALLPSVSLTGSGGLASSALLSLANPSQTLALGASLSQAIFDGGSKRGQIKISEARRQELVEQYRKAILQALKETEDALGNINLSQQQLNKQRDIVSDAQSTLAISEQRYQAGADELLSLLDAQRSLFSAQEQQANLRQSQLNATLDLIKALGGGWRRPMAGL